MKTWRISRFLFFLPFLAVFYFALCGGDPRGTLDREASEEDGIIASTEVNDGKNGHRLNTRKKMVWSKRLA